MVLPAAGSIAMASPCRQRRHAICGAIAKSRWRVKHQSRHHAPESIAMPSAVFEMRRASMRQQPIVMNGAGCESGAEVCMDIRMAKDADAASRRMRLSMLIIAAKAAMKWRPSQKALARRAFYSVISAANEIILSHDIRSLATTSRHQKARPYEITQHH